MMSKAPGRHRRKEHQLPHPNNNNWISLLVGEPVDAPPIRSVDELPHIRAAMDFTHLNTDMPRMEQVHERVVVRSRDGWDLTAEIYVPMGDGPFPVILYMHGGGWCVGSTAGVRRKTMRLAEHGFVIVNLDYSLAPERPFPNAPEDVVYAARWITQNIDRFGGDGGNLVISGDSAGANLSAAAMHVLIGDGDAVDGGDLAGVGVKLAGALLYYGVFDFPLMTSEPLSNLSWVEVAFNQAYLGPNFLAHHRDPLVSPIFSRHLADFPPCYLVCGDEDSLLGNTLAMTRALADANVQTTLSVPGGFDHTFDYVEHKLDGVTPEIDRIVCWLRKVTARA